MFGEVYIVLYTFQSWLGNYFPISMHRKAGTSISKATACNQECKRCFTVGAGLPRVEMPAPFWKILIFQTLHFLAYLDEKNFVIVFFPTKNVVFHRALPSRNQKPKWNWKWALSAATQRNASCSLTTFWRTLWSISII